MSDLIYGNNSTKNIICIEPTDNGTELFIQDDNGDVFSEIVPNRYWLLTNKKNEFSRALSGNLYYKYIQQFNSKLDLYKNINLNRADFTDTYYIADSKEAFMVRYGYTYFKGMKQNQPSVLSFDLETVGLNIDSNSKILLISNTFRKNGNIIKRLFCYNDYESQADMILDWCHWVCEIDPSVIVGHNIYGYDLKYIQGIADTYGIELCLGRNGSPIQFAAHTSHKRSGNIDYNKVHIYGREVIDTLFLAFNYDIGKKYESYTLKKIIAQEGLESSNRVFYDASNIRFNYTNPIEWEKIKAYCIDDSDDTLKLYDLMSPSFFYLTQSIPKSFQSVVESAAGSQINSMMVRGYLQQDHSIPKASVVNEYEGAISFGNVGIYRNAFKVDVSSLYPSIMIHNKVFSKDKDPKKYMLELVTTFTEQRLKNKRLAKETKEKYYDDMQSAQKIIINSMYGFMGASGLNFNYPDGAALITKHGRDILNKAVEWATDKTFKIVNADTDSITFCKELMDYISEEERSVLLKDLNAQFPERIRFEDDGYYPSIIVLAAKNYILYDGKKIKTKGSSLKDSKSEKALREFIDNTIKAMVNNTNHYLELYNNYAKEIMDIKDINRWASKKTLSNKIFVSQRKNETNVKDAINGTEYVEGDRVYTYFKSDGSLKLAEQFDGDYNKDKMLEKLYKKSQIFKEVLPTVKFPNYKLKKNKLLLESILNEKK